MFRWVKPTLIILFVTCLVSGGVYLLGQTQVGRSMLGVSGDMMGGPGELGFEGMPSGDSSEAGAASTVRGGQGQRPFGAGTGPGGRGQRPEGANGAAFGEGQRPEGGRGEHGGPGGAMGFAGILKNVGIIAVFSVVIALAQMLWQFLSRVRQPKLA